MAPRLLILFSVLILETAGGVAALIGVVASYPYQMDAGGAAGCVMIVAGMLVAWLVTVALFVRKSSRLKSRQHIDDARREAARILGEATDKALALCSLDAPRCPACGNPRTGNFCPKCGIRSGSAAGASKTA